MKFRISVFILFLAVFIGSKTGLVARGINNNFHVDLNLETKGVYSTGMSESYAYNVTGIKALYKMDYLGIASYFNQYFNYQITDGNGEYDYRSFSEAGASLRIYIYKYFMLSGEYSRAEDLKELSGNNLSRNIYYVNIELEIASAIISGAYSYEDFNYQIDSNEIESTAQDLDFGIDYYFNDSTGFDLTYTYSTLYFDSTGSDYIKNIFRAGCIYAPGGLYFLMAGVSAGRDSDDYNIFGTNISAAYYFHSHFKLIFYYSFSYFDSTDASNSSTAGSGGGSGNGNSTKGQGNPYLTSDK
ncbi:MAG: hypothetical protein JW864_05875 [Spirochaetes bacterium]|nr:hypothetical protein [Spirochaetota bacterium]